VRYFSLASFARRKDVHPLMLFTYDALAATGSRNDGYVAITDQLIPGSTLLGYVNLDHWDIALPVRERLNFGGVGSRAKARQVLLEAMLLAVSEALRFFPGHPGLSLEKFFRSARQPCWMLPGRHPDDQHSYDQDHCRCEADRIRFGSAGSP
jgi:hypothetical protein